MSLRGEVPIRMNSMTTKSSLYRHLFRGLLVDVTRAMGLVESVYPVDNKELAEAISNVYMLLDDYSQMVFRSKSVELLDDDEPERDQ